MTQDNVVPLEAPQANEIKFTQEEFSHAQQQEQAEMTQVTNQHLNNRVVMLRALVNKLQAENEQLKSQIPPEEIPEDESE